MRFTGLSHRCGAGFLKGCENESFFALVIDVAIGVRAEAGENIALQDFVFTDYGRVRAQVVAEQEVILPEGTVILGQMKVAAAGGGFGAIKRAGDSFISFTCVTKIFQNLKNGGTAGHGRAMVDAQHQVYDGFGSKAWHRGASNMLNALDVQSEAQHEVPLFVSKSHRPGRIVCEYLITAYGHLRRLSCLFFTPRIPLKAPAAFSPGVRGFES